MDVLDSMSNEELLQKIKPVLPASTTQICEYIGENLYYYMNVGRRLAVIKQRGVLTSFRSRNQTYWKLSECLLNNKQ